MDKKFYLTESRARMPLFLDFSEPWYLGCIFIELFFFGSAEEVLALLEAIFERGSCEAVVAPAWL